MEINADSPTLVITSVLDIEPVQSFKTRPTKERNIQATITFTSRKLDGVIYPHLIKPNARAAKVLIDGSYNAARGTLGDDTVLILTLAPEGTIQISRKVKRERSDFPRPEGAVPKKNTIISSNFRKAAETVFGGDVSKLKVTTSFDNEHGVFLVFALLAEKII